MPRVSDSATFSAAWRQTLQRRNRASPSFHSPVWRSKVRGVDATVKLATAAPLGVKRSSGSAVRLPTMVMGVSPAMSGRPRSGGVWVGSVQQVCRGRRSGVAAQQLGPQDGLVEAQLAVQLLGGRGLGGHLDDRVDPLGLLLDLVGQATASHDVDLVD